MKLATLRRRDHSARPGVSGVAKLDRRTKHLTTRLRPGDIAIIDHVDLDRVSAENLVAAKVGAVVNASPSISGRYPNLGPETLIAAGIPLVDDVGTAVFGSVREGAQVRVAAGSLYVGDNEVGSGTRQDAASVSAAMVAAKAGLADQLEAFAANTMQFMLRERALLLDGVGLPRLRTPIAHRHALVVVRGYDYKADLAALRPYIREYRPVLIGVDGGADALRSVGLTPDLIVGDMDSVSDDALRCGAEVVVHAYPDGRAPGVERVQDLGVDAITFPAAGTSEDIALLLADGHDAELIVAAGTHATLTEFLDKGREGMASAFLTRLRVGGRLVDAKGVSRLYRSRISAKALVLLVLAAVIAIAAVLSVSDVGRTYLGQLTDKWAGFASWVRGLFT